MDNATARLVYFGTAIVVISLIMNPSVALLCSSYLSLGSCHVVWRIRSGLATQPEQIVAYPRHYYRMSRIYMKKRTKSKNMQRDAV